MYRLYHIFLQIPEDSHTGFVLKTGILVVLLTVFIIFQAIFARSHKNRLTLEKKLLQEQFDTQLMQNKLDVQEATFEVLGTELHDNIGQLLSTAKMFVGIAERDISAPPASLIAANETLDKAIIELRSISKSLNREWLQQFDLYSNLINEMERINSGGALEISLRRSGKVMPANPEQQFMFYRLLQEAIQNVIKHAEASHLNIVINCDKINITAKLQDDGKGFDTNDEFQGQGMQIMERRVKALKGKISWQSSSIGTRVSIIFPIKNQHHEI